MLAGTLDSTPVDPAHTHTSTAADVPRASARDGSRKGLTVDVGGSPRGLPRGTRTPARSVQIPG